LEDPGIPRRTTTPLRSGRGPGRRLNLLLVAGTIVAIAVGVLQVSQGRTSSGAPAPPPCDPGACRPAVADVRAQSVAVPVAPTPCAYCGQDPQRWRQLTGTPPPEIAGKAAAVIEAACGTMIYGVNENQHLPPASLAKMVTAMVTMERTRLTDMVDIKLNGWDLAADDGSSIMGLEAGMRLSVRDLLYGMLLVSGNDAALALADYAGGTQRFVGYMNDKVRQLGLTNTHFSNPDGRDAPDQYSSALDMALIGRALLQDQTLNTVVNTKTYMPAWDGRALSNANEMIWAYDDAVGVKVGYTETADFTIVTGISRNGRLLIAAVMGSWHAYIDPVHLLNWAFANTKPACT
jgi:D-alanyl-D-alanine carboxypeptidase (penicillin-binding protein 5/6)